MTDIVDERQRLVADLAIVAGKLRDDGLTNAAATVDRAVRALASPSEGNKKGDTPVNTFPRRNRVDLFTPAEKAIWDAVQAVEAAGAHLRLTDAVILLSAARDAVADFVDGVDGIRLFPRPMSAEPDPTTGAPSRPQEQPRIVTPETRLADRAVKYEAALDKIAGAVTNIHEAWSGFILRLALYQHDIKAAAPPPPAAQEQEKPFGKPATEGHWDEVMNDPSRRR